MIRPMQIEPVLNGFIVTVGCTRTVFLSIEALTDAIERYYLDPEDTEAKFMTESLNAKHHPSTVGPADATTPDIAPYADALRYGQAVNRTY